MNRLVLTDSVQVKGANYYGLPSTISFAPSNQRGWHWNSNGKTRQITPDLATIVGHRIRLIDGFWDTLEIFEHIGGLAFLGLTDVEISCTGRIPPYVSAGHLWKFIRPNTQAVAGDEVGLKTVDRTIRWQYPEERAGHVGFTEIRPATSNELTIEILIDYAGVGSPAALFSWSGWKFIPDLKDALDVPMIGWPPSRKWQFDVASRLRWPNGNKIAWPQNYTPEEMGHILIRHRVQDVLGALSLLCQDGDLFAGHVSSVYSGHLADLRVVQKAHKSLRQL